MSRRRRIATLRADGRINAVDLEAYEVASNIAVAPFEIHD
jgi:hypothetical protein